MTVYPHPADRQFDDRQSLAIVNRDLPVPAFTNSTSGRVTTIITTSLKLTYTHGRPPPAPPAPTPAESFCHGYVSADADCGPGMCAQYRSPSAPNGLPRLTQASCCAASASGRSVQDVPHRALSSESVSETCARKRFPMRRWLAFDESQSSDCPVGFIAFVVAGAAAFPLFGRIRRNDDVEHLAGESEVPAVVLPVELSLVPDSVSSFADVCAAEGGTQTLVSLHHLPLPPSLSDQCSGALV